MRLVSIKSSPRAGKRYRALFETRPGGGTVATDFGAEGGATYIDHGDKAKRAAYLARHGAGTEDWSDPTSAGALARWILWGESDDIAANVRAFRIRFGL